MFCLPPGMKQAADVLEEAISDASQSNSDAAQPASQICLRIRGFRDFALSQKINVT